MPLATIVHTFDGTWQQITFGSATQTRLGRISFQADPGNTNPCYIAGANEAEGDGEYGERIPAPASSEPAAPLVYEGVGTSSAMTLQDFWVKGTNTEKLRINIQYQF